MVSGRSVQVLQFKECLVRLWRPDFLDTYFYRTGRTVPALFIHDPQARATARDTGYGLDVARMHREHDVVHTFLAEAEGLPWSPVLFRLAGGPEIPADERAAEEGRVLAFQRYLNTGEVDPLLERYAATLQELGERFRALTFQSRDHVYCTTCGTCLICDFEDSCYDDSRGTPTDSSDHTWPRFDE